MFGPDMLVRQALRFFGGIGQHALAFIAEGQVDRGGDLLPNGGMPFYLFPNGLDRSMRPKKTIGKRLILAQKPEQQVFRLDVRRTELTGFITREEYYAPGLFRVPFKH